MIRAVDREGRGNGVGGGTTGAFSGSRLVQGPSYILKYSNRTVTLIQKFKKYSVDLLLKSLSHLILESLILKNFQCSVGNTIL